MIGVEYMLLNTLSNQFRPENPILQLLFTLVLAKVIGHALKINLWKYFGKYFNKLNFLKYGEKGNVQIQICQNDEKHEIDILRTIDSILNDKAHQDVKRISFKNSGGKLYISDLEKTLLFDSIYVSISSETVEKKKDESVLGRYTIYYLNFTSSKYNSIEIEEKVEKMTAEWRENATKKPPQIAADLMFPSNFVSYKTFDNLFFDGKDDLIRAIDRFTNDIESYKRIGKAHTLTILLEGEPGIGKTATVKAIANKLKRSVHTINPKKYKKTSDFYGCWKKDLKTFECGSQSLSDKIIHLPEVDYLCNEFLSDAELEKKKEVVTSTDSTKLVINLEKDKKNTEDISELDKAFFRELLDGIDEEHGRVLIMTTNNPERLDPVIIREGRVDIRIKLGKMSAENLKKYLELCFQEPINNISDLPDKKLTPVKIQVIAEHCISNNLPITECVKMINNTEI